MRITCLLVLLLCAACTEGAPSGTDAAVRPELLMDCSPGPGEVPCADGLRCGLVLLGDPPYQGNLIQCVPIAQAALPEDAPCALDQALTEPTGATVKRADRCAAGLGCVPARSGGMRCQRLCDYQVSGSCDGTRLCVVPSPVSGVGTCAAPDKCQPVPPQKGCPAGPDGHVMGCYVLGDDKHADTFCLPQVVLPYSDGTEDSRCERSINCQPGLGCANVNGNDQLLCRPYCAVPMTDGGTAADTCAGEPGSCNPIKNYEMVGRCF